MLGQGLDENPVSGKLGTAVLGYFDVPLAAFQPAGIEKALVQIRRQFAAQVIATHSCPAHGQRDTPHLPLAAVFRGFHLDTGQRFDSRPDLWRGQPEITLAPTRLQLQQAAGRQPGQVSTGRRRRQPSQTGELIGRSRHAIDQGP
ncbi:hypothetical protein D3C76_1343840 [compost metagenome]